MATMNPAFFHAIKWQLYRLHERLSQMALFVIGFLIILLLWLLFAYLPLTQSVAAMQANAQPRQHSVPAVTAAEQLQAFKSQFPHIAMRASKVDQLMHIIAQQGLQVDEVRYQTDVNERQLLGRYRVTFNTQTTYPKLHRMLNAVLTDMPYVALDKLKLRRESADEDIVDVELSFNFYFKNDDANTTK
jgi:Type II secretion system (T2SS), protein M subtype b